MKNYLKNKFLITVIIISVLLVGTSCFMSLLGYSSYIRNAIGSVITPVQRAVDNVMISVSEKFVTKSEYEELKNENEELKRQLYEAEERLHDASLAEDENKQLKTFLGIKDEHTDFELTDAKVIGSENGIVTLDKGSFHGITADMPVVDDYGLVGKIVEVGYDYSKMLTVIGSASSIAVKVEETDETGIVKGQYSLFSKGLALLTFLPADSNIKIGDRIVTSGDGSLFPEGLDVGEVTEIFTDEYTRDIKAYIKPSAEISALGRVMIITKYEKNYS